MTRHADIAKMAAKAFAEHRMTKGPGMSWRLARLGTGTYSFRITWTPGAVTVTGDLGSTTYEAWPSFSTLWGAVELISSAHYDYLFGKSGAKTVFDPEATVQHAVEFADSYMRDFGDFQFWERIVAACLFGSFYRHPVTGERTWLENPRSGAVQMRALAELRREDLTPDRIYDILGDPEMISYAPTPETRWHYEAVTLWARTMLMQEPAWHRLWRRYRRQRDRLRRDLRQGLLWRPTIYRPTSRGEQNETWVRHDSPGGGASWRAVVPFRPFGLDLSSLGLWCYQGSCTPVRDAEDDRRFVPAEALQ